VKIRIRTIDGFHTDLNIVVGQTVIYEKSRKFEPMCNMMIVLAGREIEIVRQGKKWRARNDNQWIIEPWMVEEKYREAMNEQGY
jgi:hypothetical protein